MDKPTPFPHVSDALIAALEEAFPPKDAKPTDTYAELQFHGGIRKVVKFLRHQNEIQNENILNS